jgi:hypothetical protein
LTQFIAWKLTCNTKISFVEDTAKRMQQSGVRKVGLAEYLYRRQREHFPDDHRETAASRRAWRDFALYGDAA